MAGYDRRQMNAMRQDAMRRTREMYSRSAVNSSHYPAGAHEDKAPVPSGQPQAGQKPKDPLNSLADELFGGSADGDKLLVAALALLLMKEGADMKLILALGYIFL